MKRPVLKLVLALVPLAIVAWFWVTSVSIEEIVPATTGAVIRVNRPLDSAESLAGSEMATTLAGMPDAEFVGALLGNWNNLKKHDAVLAIMAFFLRSVHVGVPSDLTRYSAQQMPFTTYIDAGVLGRAVGLLADVGALAKVRAFAEHRGVRLYQKGWSAVAFVRNMLVVGKADAVIQSIDAFAGGRAPLRDNPERFRESLKLADPDAPANVMLLSRSYFRAPEERSKPFDPRAFVAAAAIESATVNVYVKGDGLSLRMQMTGMPGKILSPLTNDKPQAHATVCLPDEGTYIYASVRVARPSALAPVLLSMVSGSQNMQPLQKKLVTLLLNSFLENTGDEVALALDFDTPGGFPTLLFQVRNMPEMKKILDRMAQSEELRRNALNLPVGANGETLLQLMARSPGTDELTQALRLYPAEQRAEIVALANKIRRGAITPDQIALDPQRIGMFGRALHWRIVDDYLVLAPLPDLANRYATNLRAKKALPELSANEKPITLDGPFLAWINFAAPLALADPTNERLPSWLAARHPRAVVGSKVTDERLQFDARLSFNLGVRATTLKTSTLWTGLLLLAEGLGFLLVAYCLYVAFKATRHLVRGGQ